MPPSMQERTEGLAALRVRATIATGAMYAMIGKEQPAQAVRFQVVNKGTGAYHVIRAQVLEARADGKNINIEGWSQ